MVAAKLTIEFTISSQLRQYKINVLRNIGYVSLYDLASCCDFDAVEKLGSKEVQQLFGAFKHEPGYENVDPLYYIPGGDKSDPMKSTYVHPDIALCFVRECRPVLALWITKQIREALLDRALDVSREIEAC